MSILDHPPATSILCQARILKIYFSCGNFPPAIGIFTDIIIEIHFSFTDFPPAILTTYGSRQDICCLKAYLASIYIPPVGSVLFIADIAKIHLTIGDLPPAISVFCQTGKIKIYPSIRDFPPATGIGSHCITEVYLAAGDIPPGIISIYKPPYQPVTMERDPAVFHIPPIAIFCDKTGIIICPGSVFYINPLSVLLLIQSGIWSSGGILIIIMIHHMHRQTRQQCTIRHPGIHILIPGCCTGRQCSGPEVIR